MQELQIEIYLPTADNEGVLFEDALYLAAQEELVNRFEGVSLREALVDGLWRHDGRVYGDRLKNLFLIVADNDANRKFFKSYKERLKTIFRQLDILMTAVSVERF